MDDTYPRFETTPYRAEGGFTPIGSGLLLFGSLLGGLILGVLAGFISRWFYLVLLFPMLIGAGVAGIGYLAIRHGKVRNSVLGAISGLLGGFFAMLSMHYLNYMEFERQMDVVPPQFREMERRIARMSPDEIRALNLPPETEKQFLDQVQRAAYRVQDLPTYMNFRAVRGVTFSRASGGDKDKGMNLGYIGSWIYWSVEILIVAGMALSVQYVAAREPFCSLCQNWKPARDLGVVPETDVAALQEGDLAHFNNPAAPEASSLVAVNISSCPQCGVECSVDVKLLRLNQTKEGVIRQQIAYVTYPGEALPYIDKIFQAPSPPADPTPSGADENEK